MSVLDRKLRRDLRIARGMLLAITSIMAVGVMSFIYMRSAYFNLSLEQQKFYAECRMADFWLDFKRVPLADLERLREIPEIVDFRSRIQFSATVDLEQVAGPLNGLVLTLPDRRETVINDIVLRRGSYFTDRRENEVIVNDAFARHHRVRPGDWIHLLLGNRRQELLVVGTAISSEFIYLLSPGAIAPDPERFGVFYIKQSYAEDVFDMDGAANQVVGLLSPEARLRPEPVLDRAERLLEAYGMLNATARKDQASNLFLTSEIQGLGVFATIMPVIFLSVAALVLNVLMSRLVDQQRTVIGTLKAIGYRDRQVFGHFVKFGLAVGVAGGVLGLIAGYFMANWITSIYLEFYEFPELRNHFYPGTYLAGLSISVGCALIGSVQGARTTLHLSPAEAMRPKPPASGRAVWLERIVWLWNRLTFGWRMALRNVIRNKLRTAVSLFAAATGASILVLGFMASNAMVYLIDFQFQRISRSDYDLNFESERGADALIEARQLPGVDYAEPVLNVPCTLSNGRYRRKGAITGLTTGARLTLPRDTAGNRLAIPAHGLLITRKLADTLHVAAGDTLLVQPTRGTRQIVRMPVVQVAESYMGTAVYANLDYVNHLLGEERAITGVQLAANPAPAVQRELYYELKHLPALEAVGVRQDVIDNMNNTIIKTQKIFIGLLTFFGGVIFCGSILNASLVSLTERMREMATLRVLGYSEWEIGKLLFRESMIVNTLGTLLGLPLGYLLCMYVASSYDTDLLRFPLVTTPSIWINTLVASLIFALFAQGAMQWRINRLDWLAALQVKE